MLKLVASLALVAMSVVPTGMRVDIPLVRVCSTPGAKIGPCMTAQGSVGNGTADIYAEDATGQSGSRGTTRRDAESAPDPDAWTEQRARDAAARGNARDPFVVVTPPAPPIAITIADIASFAPTPGGNNMEPNGWIVVGLDTNFYSDGGVRVVDGTLLGQPAAVRFTPLSWRWSYGDGSSKSSATPGASWAAQGLQEFDPTATSHVFANAGTYAIDLTVQYTAEYQFAGSGWVPIAGTLERPANRIVATASDASTVLVKRDCRQNPAGPGC